MDKQNAKNERAMVDLYNQEMKELQESQKQEEMMKLEIEESTGFYSAFINNMRISRNKPLGVSKTFMTFSCPKKYILQALGIPEGAVVLTREELEERDCKNHYEGHKTGVAGMQEQVEALNTMYNDALTDYENSLKSLREIRKETAEKFADKLRCEYIDFDDYDEISVGSLREDISKICKKFTEGKE